MRLVTLLERVEVRMPQDGLPLLVDDVTLAFHLGLRNKVLWYGLTQRDKAFKHHRIPKSSGGLRDVYEPNTVMRAIHERLREKLLLPLVEKLGAHVTAYRPGQRTFDAARHHMAPCAVCEAIEVPHTCEYKAEQHGTFHRVVASAGCAACVLTPVPHECPRRGVKVHLDLKDFFPSTRKAWVRQYFHLQLGYSHRVSGMLAHLVTLRQGKGDTVPQGGPASGDICNLVTDVRLDTPLLKALEGSGWTYSRYADDLYFSHPQKLSRETVDAFLLQVEAVVKESGWRLNRKKQHVQRPGKQQRLLGMVVNQKPNMPAAEFRRMRALLHSCVRFGFEAQLQRTKKETVGQLHSWLEGKLAYWGSIAPHKAQYLRAQLAQAYALHEVVDVEVKKAEGA